MSICENHRILYLSNNRYMKSAPFLLVTVKVAGRAVETIPKIYCFAETTKWFYPFLHQEMNIFLQSLNIDLFLSKLFFCISLSVALNNLSVSFCIHNLKLIECVYRSNIIVMIDLSYGIESCGWMEDVCVNVVLEFQSSRKHIN